MAVRLGLRRVVAIRVGPSVCLDFRSSAAGATGVDGVTQEEQEHQEHEEQGRPLGLALGRGKLKKNFHGAREFVVLVVTWIQ